MFFTEDELIEIGKFIDDNEHLYYDSKHSANYESLIQAFNKVLEEDDDGNYSNFAVLTRTDEVAVNFTLDRNVFLDNQTLTTITRQEQIEDFKEDKRYDLVDALFDLKEKIAEEQMELFELKMTEQSKQKNTKSIEFAEKVYLPFPHMRKRRKQWGGKPTYRTYELNVKVSYGYAKRSMLRHFPVLTTYDWKKTKEKTRRSLSHTYLWKFAEMTPFETLNTRFEDDLFSAYKELGYKIMQDEMYTDGMRDAWQTYMSEGTFEQFLQDNYAPTITAFSELTGAVKDFIADEWDKYSKEARSGREERYGMQLSNEQIDNLQDADLSYL